MTREMLDKEAFIKRETEVEEKKILDWCGTILKAIIGGLIVLTPLALLFCICLSTFGRESTITCVSALFVLIIIAMALFIVFEFSNKIAYRKACKSWEKEHKIQEKRQKDEDRAIDNIRFLILFDIIRKKNVSASLIKSCKTAEEYNKYMNMCPSCKLTKEEYDLAKEILG